MNGTFLRGAIVGASTLLGKELAEELAVAPGLVWDLTLLDNGEAGGQMASAGDEALLIQPIAPGAFDAMDVVFFAGAAAEAAQHADAAQAAGANLVDLSGGLLNRPGMLLRSPWTGGGPAVDLSTLGIVSANAAALMLAVVAERLHRVFGRARLIATVLQPASQQGSAGLDELHQQTVGLLSFQQVQKDLYDAQVAFNLRASLGAAARVSLAAQRAEIQREFAGIARTDGEVAIALQLLQAPVFHGFTASVFVQTAEAPDMSAVREALDGGVLRLAEEAHEAPSNEAAASQTQILVSITAEEEAPGDGHGFWLWMAADNLRLQAHHAAACAGELGALRPIGNVQ